MAIITWRNIESDGFRGAAGLMEVARRSLNDGFTGLQSTLQQTNTVRDQNWDAQKQANTNAFLDRLARFKTPEELAAAQQAGELDALRQQFGGQVDSTAIRNAEANAQQQLIERIARQNQHLDDTQARNQRGELNDLYGMLGDPQQHAVVAQRLQQNDYGAQEQSLASALRDAQKSWRGEKREDTRLGFEGSRLQLARNADQRAQTTFNDNRTDLLSGRATDLAVTRSLEGAGSHAEARQRFIDWARDNKVSGTRLNNGLQALGQLYKQAVGLDEEQDAVVQKAVAPLLRSADLADQHAKGLAPFSDPALENITEQGAMAQILKRVPGEEDNTLSKVQQHLDRFRKDNPEYQDMNLGPVLAQALGATGLNEGWIMDNSLNFSDFQKKLQAAAKTQLRYAKAQQTARDARSLAESRKAEETNKIRRLNILHSLK